MMQAVSKKHWVILGAKKLGCGFLSHIGTDLGYGLTLAVTSKDESKRLVDLYNAQRHNGGFTILFPGPAGPQAIPVTDYEFTWQETVLIRRIASNDTQVVSTSVNIGNLRSAITDVLTEGITLRAQEGVTTPLLILACENGRSLLGLTPSAQLKEWLHESLDKNTREYAMQYVTIPEVVADCVVANPLNEQFEITREWGLLCVEESPTARRYLASSPYVKIVADAKLIHWLKLYGFNSLHLYLCVLGSFLKAQCVHEVAGHSNPELARLIQQVVGHLKEAIQRQTSPVSAAQDSSHAVIDEYCDQALRRLQAQIDDPVDRIFDKLHKHAYLLDRRLDGPVFSLGLNKDPHKALNLVRCLSLALFVMWDTPSAPFAQGLAPRERAQYLAKMAGVENQEDFFQILRFIWDTILNRPNAVDHFPLSEVLVDDLRYLAREQSKRGDRGWTPAEMVAFFERQPTPLECKERPKLTAGGQLECIVLDMDEVLCSSEAYLYEATYTILEELCQDRQKVSQYTLHEYSNSIGISETLFFAHLSTQFKLADQTPQELIRKRDEKYLSILSRLDPSVLLKPGIKDLLELIRKSQIKMGLFSNASGRRVHETLKHLQLHPYFTWIQAHDETLISAKPHPDMLQRILESAGCAPEKCLVIESSGYGMAAAVAMGVYRVAVTSPYIAPERLTHMGLEFAGTPEQIASWLKPILDRRN
jgi:beta-phosphoglucomutase